MKRLMTNTAALGIVGCIALVTAGCGGGGGLSKIEEEALQQQLEAEADARKKAEEEKLEAERKLREEETARREAEQETETAETQRDEEQRKAAEAEQERKRLADEAAEAQQRLDAAAARRALAGTHTTGTTATLAAKPQYNAAASITTPSLAGTPSTSSAGRWLKTTLSTRTAATRDMIEIYSDVEAPKRSDFATSSYNSGNSVINGAGDVIGSVTIANDAHGRLVASGSFPRVSGTPQQLKLVDRGPTQAEIDADPNDDITGTGRDEQRFPSRWMVEASGTLQGASGRFRCGGADNTAVCTVQNRGGSFHFSTGWQFVPSSGTVKILVNDSEFMWFGWWSRYTIQGDSWAFEAKHGGNALTDVAAVTGTATYRGQAAGHYAIHEPATGDSGTGNFTASAQFQADFDADTVSGSITGFSNAPGWALTLNSRPIASGAVAAAGNTVTWSINEVPVDSGSWEASFYSNLPTDQSTGVQPYGIAGTFQADYGSTGRLIGAFGAHK